LARLEKALDGKDYLEGKFTVGDLMMADVLRILDHTDLLDDYPQLSAYKRRCEARQAFKRAMEAQDRWVQECGLTANCCATP
jgi:glutathione S-transferase